MSTRLASLAPTNAHKAKQATDAWVLEHLPSDDLNALATRAREYRHASLVFESAAERARELVKCQDEALAPCEAPLALALPSC